MGEFTQLSQEERSIESTLADVRFLVMARSFPAAAKRMGELRLHLEQHLETEHQLVPIFLQRTGDPASLVPRLSREHDRIPERCEAVCCAITQWDSARALYELDRLTAALEAHQDTEDELVHPALDDLVPDEIDWDTLHFQLLSAHPPS